jgi:flagellar motor switch protein FliN
MTAEPPVAFSKSPESPASTQPVSLDLLMGLELPVVVRFGAARMRLSEVAQLKSGSTIALERASETAVEILVNDRVVARGEAVVVEGNYGVRITEVLSGADRL